MAGDVIEFERGDVEGVVVAMETLARAGAGWINLEPLLSDQQMSAVESPGLLGGWFSARGPAIPVATWLAASGGRRPSPASIGVEHAMGPDGLGQLARAGLDLPSGWVRRQDHAKRGIVVELPADADSVTVVQWLLDACWMLCLFDRIERWTAEVHRPR